MSLGRAFPGYVEVVEQKELFAQAVSVGCNIGSVGAAVSYTHLDVYKRQVRNDLWDETCILALKGQQIQPFFIEVTGITG